ncbi:MAG: radical SAM protein [Bacteriovorax sp.]|nr:radical SAM protein [Bacteriovorax sp.]
MSERIIQSLSIDIPGGCPNNCRFCVAHMHENPYQNRMLFGKKDFDVAFNDYLSRLRYVQKCGCQTIVLTGSGEPLVNKRYLFDFSLMMRLLGNPFEKIELQTSGVHLDDEYLEFLKKTVMVSTISLSLSDIFDDQSNADIEQIPEKLRFEIETLCQKIKSHHINLRLSLNMSDVYNTRTPGEIFSKAKSLGADQVTIRKLYTSPKANTPQDQWILEHLCSPNLLKKIKKFIKKGTKLEILPFGAILYSVCDMSVVLDDDCMNQTVKNTLKYAILRSDCHLYSRWDNPGSLIV